MIRIVRLLAALGLIVGLAGGTEVPTHRQRDLVAVRGPHGVEGAEAGAMKQRTLARAIGVHDLDARVPGAHDVHSESRAAYVVVLAEQHLTVVERIFGEGFVHEQLELGIWAERGDKMLSGAEPADALKHDMCAVG